MEQKKEIERGREVFFIMSKENFGEIGVGIAPGILVSSALEENLCCTVQVIGKTVSIQKKNLFRTKREAYKHLLSESKRFVKSARKLYIEGEDGDDFDE